MNLYYKSKQILSYCKSLFSAKRKFFTLVKAIKRAKKQNPHISFFVLTPTHTNLGDHAITYTFLNIFKSLNIAIFSLSFQELCLLKAKNHLNIMNGNPIFINGGGNLGTLWPNLELVMRCVISSNPNSTITILPNTIFYSNSEKDFSELNISKQIFNSHSHVKIFARERYSYEFMKNHYNDVELCPDIVLSLNQTQNLKREGCLLCLRQDKEKTLTKHDLDIITEQLKHLFSNNIKHTDTHSTKPFPPQMREEKINEKLTEFSESKLVITDRLHGMIFAAITSTPCIVLNSLSPKVIGSYEWIKNCPYVEFCDDITNLCNIYHSITKKPANYTNSHLEKYFNHLKDVIKLSAEN